MKNNKKNKYIRYPIKRSSHRDSVVFETVRTVVQSPLYYLFTVENSPTVVFRQDYCGRAPTPDGRCRRRPADAIPQLRRVTRAVARGHRGDDTHRRSVVRATEYNDADERVAGQSRNPHQGPEVSEHIN